MLSTDVPIPTPGSKHRPGVHTAARVVNNAQPRPSVIMVNVSSNTLQYQGQGGALFAGVPRIQEKAWNP